MSDLAKAFPTRRIRERRPTLESQLRQLWRAAREQGLNIIVTVEADKITAQPQRASAAGSEGADPDEPPRRSLFKTRVQPKKRVVL